MAEFPPEAPWGEVNMDDLDARVARALSIPQHHTTWDLLSDAEKDLFYMQAEYAITAYNPNDRLREALEEASQHLFNAADLLEAEGWIAAAEEKRELAQRLKALSPLPQGED